jgi:hypothetical protein
LVDATTLLSENEIALEMISVEGRKLSFGESCMPITNCRMLPLLNRFDQEALDEVFGSNGTKGIGLADG